MTNRIMKDEFHTMIERAESVGIFGHVRPDGDCIGSCLGLYNYITNRYDKDVTVYLEEVPDKFAFLHGADQICLEPTGKALDLAISLDCGDRERHGRFYDDFGAAKHSICLDHHRSNQGFGEYFYCDPDASSACEILYHHLDPKYITCAAAECLYLGIVHDTGVFKYPACTRETMRVAGDLLAYGVDAQKIIDDTFYRVTYKQNLITGQAMLDAKRTLDGRVVYTCVTQDMFRKYDCGKPETEGIIDQIRVIEGVEVAIFAYQVTEGETWKFSLRSIRQVDVSKIAVSFGGGGHIRAAGFEAEGSFETVLARILEMIEEQL